MSYWPTVQVSSGTIKSQIMASDGVSPIETHTDIDGEKYLATAMIQAVHASAANSYNTNLAAGAIWIGTNESTLGVAGIQTVLNATQNCAVTVEQSGDGTNWDVADSYTYYYSKGAQSWTTQAVGASYRVKVQNLGSSATTTFRCNTALCPVVEAVPRALNANGNMKVSVEELGGFLGTKVKTSPMGNLRVSEVTRLVGATFGDSSVLDANFWGSIAVGSGTLTALGNEVILETGVRSSGGNASIQSVRSARYISGQSNFYRSVIRVPASTGTCTRRWGAYDASNGFFFETDGTTLSVVCRKGGSDTNKVASGSFNGDAGNVYTLAATATTFEIYWTNKKAYFLIDDVLIHTFTGANATMVNTDSLPVRAETINAVGNTANNRLDIRVHSISRQGPLGSQPIFKNQSGAATNVLKYGAGNLHRVNLNLAGAAGARMVIYDGLVPAAINSWGTYDIGMNNTGGGGGANVPMIPGGWDFAKAPFSNGLLVITTGAADIGVVYE